METPAQSTDSRSGVLRSSIGGVSKLGGKLIGENRGFALGDQFIVSATNFITGAIIGRTCAKDEFGLYLLGLSIVFIALDLQSSLISSPYMVLSPRLEGRDRVIFTGSSAVHYVALALTVVSALVVGRFVVVPRIGIEGLSSIIAAVAIALPFIMIREYVRRIFFANLQFRSAVVMGILVAILQVGLVVGLSTAGNLSAASAFAAVGIASALAALTSLYFNRAIFGIDWRSVAPDLQRSWTIGKWIFASGVLWTASANLYPWILTFFHGTESAGVWAACIGFVAICNPFLLGIQNLLGPKISHTYASQDHYQFKAAVFRFSGWFVAATLPLFFILLFFGNLGVGFVYGQKYLGNWEVVAVLGFNLIFAAFRFIYSRALFVMNRARSDFVINVATLFVMMTIGVWCIIEYGPLGVAIGILIGNVAASIMKFFAFRITVVNADIPASL